MEYCYVRVMAFDDGNPLEWVEEDFTYIPKENIFVDYCETWKSIRPEYERLKQVLQPGDELYVYDLNRIGRLKSTTKDGD